MKKRRRPYNSKAAGRDFAVIMRFVKFAPGLSETGRMTMRNFLPHITVLLAAFVLMASGAEDCRAQKRRRDSKTDKTEKITVEEFRPQPQERQVLHYIVEGKDTIFIDEIRASKVYSRLPRQKGKSWRKYYRLVHNFGKTYPYALVARKLVEEADSTIEADNLKRLKRDRYIDEIQKELFDVFEGQMRNLTVSQGALLMKLIDREVGKSSFNIIKDYKSGMAAGFWQGIAKMFGTDLKKPYDPEGEDLMTEELVFIWENGEYEALYKSLFWNDPPKVDIPEKFL